MEEDYSGQVSTSMTRLSKAYLGAQGKLPQRDGLKPLRERMLFQADEKACAEV